MKHLRWLLVGPLILASFCQAEMAEIQGEMIMSCQPVYQTTAEAMLRQAAVNARSGCCMQKKYGAVKRDASRKFAKNHPQSPCVAAMAYGQVVDTPLIPEDADFMAHCRPCLTRFHVEEQKAEWNAATLAATGGSFPPDTMGDVSENQVIIALNGLIRSFDKAGNPDGALEITPKVFFEPVSGGVDLADPRIRFDKTSGRWFIIIMSRDAVSVAPDVPNSLFIAVSPTAVVTPTTQWTLFGFQQDLIFPSGQSNLTIDYPTLGIDVNALYIGLAMHDIVTDAYVTSDALVVNKASLLSGGPAIATIFRALGLIYIPQGADNFDPAATVGWFIGSQTGVLGTLIGYRVNTPAGVPTLTGPTVVVVPATLLPLRVPHLRNNNGIAGQLDEIDDRLMCAHVRGDSLWTVHHIAVNNAGASGVVIPVPDRNGCRWYELDVTGNALAPAPVQVGTLFDPTIYARFYWMPSIFTSGQGHMMIGCSVAGTLNYVDAVVARRLDTDAPGSIRFPAHLTNTVYAYNPAGDPGSLSVGRRWGDYSKTMIDPIDDMSFWTFQEYTNATNSYAVRVCKVLAPAPTVASILPVSAAAGNPGVPVTITGTGFFETLPDSYALVPVQVIVQNSTGATLAVSAVTVVNDTTITASISTVGAALGAYNVIVINPDGQQAVLVNGFTVT